MLTTGVQSHPWVRELRPKPGQHELMSTKHQNKQLTVSQSPYLCFSTTKRIDWQNLFIKHGKTTKKIVKNQLWSTPSLCQTRSHLLCIPGSSNADGQTDSTRDADSPRHCLTQRETIQSLDERVSHQTPKHPSGALDYEDGWIDFHPSTLLSRKEGINPPSPSRQAFDSTINIFHKASIKSDYIFAWNVAAKC